MKYFLTSAATALVLGTATYAQEQTSAFTDKPFDAATNVYASNIIGARVYMTEADLSTTKSVAEDGETEWEDIGEINDVILTRDGDVQSVIVGVGGFIGIGEKDVALDMDQITFVSDGESAEDYFLVINANVSGVEEAPAYERTSLTEPMEESNRQMLTAPAVEREGYATVEIDDLTAEDLTGARVYGANDEDVGEIDEILLTDDGKIDRAVIDVGGFLGIGERPVAVTLDELQITRSEDGDDVRVYIDSTQEMLEAQPEYEG